MFLWPAERLIPARAATLALILGTVSVPAAIGQGVPTLDGRGIAELLIQMDQDRDERAAEVDENAKRQDILDKQDEQLAALDETLELLTGTSAFIPDLEGGGAAGEASPLRHLSH